LKEESKVSLIESKSDLNNKISIDHKTNCNNNETKDTNDSILKAYEYFKTEEISDYKCEIPSKYQTKQLLISEEIKSNGQSVKYFDNSIKEVHYKNNNFTRV